MKNHLLWTVLGCQGIFILLFKEIIRTIANDDINATGHDEQRKGKMMPENSEMRKQMMESDTALPFNMMSMMSNQKGMIPVMHQKDRMSSECMQFGMNRMEKMDMNGGMIKNATKEEGSSGSGHLSHHEN